MNKLLAEYVQARNQINRLRNEKKMQIRELKQLQRCRTKIRKVELSTRIADLENERQILGGMAIDCTIAIQWMKNGFMPGTRWGGGRRTYTWDPAWLNSLRFTATDGMQCELTADERFRLEDVLSTLSERERACYTLHHAFGMSLGQIAKELQISKASVQVFLARAEQKIKESKCSSLVLVPV